MYLICVFTGSFEMLKSYFQEISDSRDKKHGNSNKKYNFEGGKSLKKASCMTSRNEWTFCHSR